MHTCGRDLDNVTLREKIVSPKQTNAYTWVHVNFGHHSKFKKTGSIQLVIAYWRCKTLFIRSFTLWQKYCFYFLGQENEQNLRQKHLTPFSANLLVLEQICIETHLQSLTRSIRWCNNISNVFNNFGDSEEENTARFMFSMTENLIVPIFMKFGGVKICMKFRRFLTKIIYFKIT